MHRTSCMVAVWSAVILVSSVLGPTSASENVSVTFDLARLSEVMEHLCPYDAMCGNDEPRLQLENDSGKESCCTACSCEETCGLKDNCCFPYLDIHNLDTRRHQHCIAASTKEPDQGHDFYMVVERPANGSSEECGDDSVTCGENNLATPLGSLYPVSDKSSGIIYKNEKCALCHGVSKSDFLVWDAVFVCSLADETNNVALDVGTFMQSFETGKLSEWCAYNFFYPGSYKDVKSERCYEHTVHHCTLEHVSDQLNMTGEEIKAACLSDFKAPYLDIFFNVFCYICNEELVFPEWQCDEPEPMAELESRANPMQTYSSFSVLIDPYYMEKKAKAATSNRAADGRTVCRIRKGKTLDTGDCRQALCPSGQVLIGQTCDYPTREVISSTLSVVLKLYPTTIMRASSLDVVKTRLGLTLRWTSILWTIGLQPWSLKHVLYNQKLDEDGDIVNYLWIKLETTKGQTTKKLVSNINNIVNQKWKIRLNDSVALLQPKFAEFSNLRFKGNDTYIPMYNIATDDAGLSKPLLKEVMMYVSCMHCPTISKMFFCDQVALETDEYRLDAQSRILHVNDKNQTFYSTEFSLGYDVNGNFYPKVCLDDANFGLMTSAADAVSYPNHGDMYDVFFVSFVCLLVRSTLL